MNLKSKVLWWGLLPFLFVNSLAQTDSSKCRYEIKGGKYKWARVDALSGEPSSFFGFVFVKPPNINRDFMVKMARRLKAEYCKADKFQVVIFDNENFANSNALRDLATSSGKIVLMRGFYTFDRLTGKDLLEFSSTSGNPTSEIEIDLTKIE